MEWRGKLGMQRVLYVLSFLAFPAGLVIGAVLMLQPDDESKRVGMACMVYAAIAFVLVAIVSLACDMAFMNLLPDQK